MSVTTKDLFVKLSAVDVNKHTDELKTGRKDDKGNPITLTYLSWSWAIDYISKECPDFSYEVKMFSDEKGNKVPFVFDASTGYMVFTSVTISGETKDMWMPVLDSNNFAMLNHVYQVKTKFREYTVSPATMSDINRAIMRCLVKNIAMFGLGLYIYQKENLPVGDTDTTSTSSIDKKEPEKEITGQSQKNSKHMSEEELKERCDMIDFFVQLDPHAVEKLMKVKKVSSVDELDTEYLRKVYNAKKGDNK